MTVKTDKMVEAARNVIASASDTYKKRNGHLGSFEDDSGEKCWIVPFDAFEGLRAALSDHTASAQAGIVDLSPSVDFMGPQDISSAPPMTDVLVWWPIVKLDEDGDPTDEIVGGCWIISEDQGGYWIEPEVMTAIGDHMGDDHTYADKPSHWMPLPTPLFTAASEGAR